MKLVKLLVGLLSPGVTNYSPGAGGLKTRFSCIDGSMLYSPLSNNQWSISAKLQQNSEIRSICPTFNCDARGKLLAQRMVSGVTPNI